MILDPGDRTPIDEKNRDAQTIRAMRELKARNDRSTEARLRNDVRTDALNLLLRFFDLRLNTRVTHCVETWENIFEELARSKRLSVLSVADAPMSLMSMASGSVNENGSLPAASAIEELQLRREELYNMFTGFEESVQTLNQNLFCRNIISNDAIRSDLYEEGDFRDLTVQMLLDLTTFREKSMTQPALSMLIRNMSQRTALVEGLKEVQIIVYPAAAKVYKDTLSILKILGALQKQIARDVPEAYAEVGSLLDRLTDYLRVRPDVGPEIVLKNQSIMINLGIDKPVRNLLKLYLGRDTSRKDAREMEADIPLNLPRRDLFQVS